MKTKSPTRILHITESMGGGTASALGEFVASTPELEHHLVYSERAGSPVDVALDSSFASHTPAGGGLLELRSAARAAVERIEPDLVHLHSSWAGLLGRLTLSTRLSSRPSIVYSPHCFYFERNDIGRIAKAASYALERALARRCDGIICVSPHESTLALKFRARRYVVPNTTRSDRCPAAIEEHAFEVVTVGRICAQKDPDFMLAVVADLRAAMPSIRIAWIGSGSATDTKRLEAAGVVVTGWLARRQILSLLARSSSYLHTASWESCPMSVVEAIFAEIPVVARSIPAIRSIGLPGGLDSPREVADSLLAILNPVDDPEQRGLIARRFREAHSNMSQRSALLAAYDGCLKEAAARRQHG